MNVLVKGLERLTELAELARIIYEDCIDVLTAHERFHGCAPSVEASMTAGYA
jgi:hypothetical protein